MFISCTAIRAVDVVERIEQRLGKPVVSANQAQVWQAPRWSGYSSPPRLRRIAYLDEMFWEFCTQSNLPDLAADLMGPDVRFRECQINIKWQCGGQEVTWHQDIPFTR